MRSYWRKLGLLYAPSGKRHEKLLTHAANPLAIPLGGDMYRIFYSGRDEKQRSSVGAVDVDLAKGRVVCTYDEPFFTHGPAGSFYADGVSIGNCYVAQGQCYMLFMGWQVEGQPHWRGDIGRLLVKEDLTLAAETDCIPLMGIDDVDPVSLSYPWVLPRSNGGFDMWYGSTLVWDAGNGDMLHVINHAFSVDGHQWQRHGLTVPYQLGLAQAFSRPTVISSETGGYEMWFSYRGGTGETYRIGYANSPSPLGPWKLGFDERSPSVSCDGWDSEMIAYPYVFKHRDHHYMLYNGNGYGRTGFGLAIREYAE